MQKVKKKSTDARCVKLDKSDVQLISACFSALYILDFLHLWSLLEPFNDFSRTMSQMVYLSEKRRGA